MYLHFTVLLVEAKTKTPLLVKKPASPEDMQVGQKYLVPFEAGLKLMTLNLIGFNVYYFSGCGTTVFCGLEGIYVV
jgi:hypothetical protein